MAYLYNDRAHAIIFGSDLPSRSRYPLPGSYYQSFYRGQPVDVDGNNQEAEREIETLNFVHTIGMNRRRVFPLKVGKAETVASIQEKLADELEASWQPLATKSGDIRISHGREVLPHDFCPARLAQHGKEYTIHILPADKKFIQMELEIKSDSRKQRLPAVMFALENATVEALCEQISRISSYPPASVTIYVNTRKPNEEESDMQEERKKDKVMRPSGDEEDAIFNELRTGPRRNADPSGREHFEPLSLSSDAVIKDHPETFHHGCLLRVEHRTTVTLLVKVKFDVNQEVFEFRLDTKGGIDHSKQAIAKEMGTDARRLTLLRVANHYTQFGEQTNKYFVEVQLRTKAAEVFITHVDGAFEYPYFVQDTTETTVGEVAREVEKKHDFRRECVQLYLNNTLLNSDLTLREVGVKMDSRLTVHTKGPGSISQNAGRDSISSANTLEACEQKEKRHTRETSSTTENQRWNLSAISADVGDSEESAEMASQNVGSRFTTGGNQHYKYRDTDPIPNASNAAHALETQTIVLSRQREMEDCYQTQAIQKRSQRSTGSRSDYEDQVAGMARALFGGRKVRLTSAPDCITVPQDPRKTKILEQLRFAEAASKGRDAFVGPQREFPPDPVQRPPSRPRSHARDPDSQCLAVASRPPMEVARYNRAAADQWDAKSVSSSGPLELNSNIANQSRACGQPDKCCYVIETRQQTKIQLPLHVPTEQQLVVVAQIADAQSRKNAQSQQTSQMVGTTRPQDTLDKAIDYVSRNMVANDWHQLIFTLGLTCKDLDDFQTEHPKDMFLQIMKGLNRWRQAEGSKATVQVLVEKLRVNKCADLADILTKMFLNILAESEQGILD